MEVGIAWDDGGLRGEVGVTKLDALLQEKTRRKGDSVTAHNMNVVVKHNMKPRRDLRTSYTKCLDV